MTAVEVIQNIFNGEADFWRNDIGVNTIPYDTANVFKSPKGGKPLIKWSTPVEGQKLGLKDRPMSNEEFDELKKNNKFRYGIAIMPGKIHHREECKNCFLYVIDIDDAKAMKAFLTAEDGHQLSLEYFADFIIEQHEDNLCKAHLYGYSTKQLKSMSKAGLEVLTEPVHLVNVSPSIHENGYPYVRRGAPFPNVPLTDTAIERHLNNVFKRLGYSYLDKEPVTVTSASDQSNPFAVNEESIQEGSRNNKFYRKCCSLLRKNMGKIPLDDIKVLAINYNTRNCKPPLGSTECETIWKSAVDFITRKAKEEKQKQKQEQGEEEESPPILEDELSSKYKFKSLKDNDEIYHWNKDKGIYVKNSEWLIKQECMMSDPQMKSKEVNEVINHIKWSNYIDRTDLDSKIEWLSMKSGIVNLKTGEIKDHSPDYLTTMQIPHNYKPMPETYKSLISKDGKLAKLSSVDEWGNLCKCKCPCPRIMEFLYQVIAAEDVETVLDFMAYCLWRGFPFHKYLLFNGSGRNGKGVTIAIFKKLLGQENIAAESLMRLLTNNFASAKLFRKMANIDADLSNEALKNTGLLKKLTGDDDIPAEEKYKPAFHFKNYAKLIFSANQIPKTPDETDAFFARLIIINFPNQYLGDKADPWLLQKLTTKEEMDGLLSLVIARLPRVLESGIYVTQSSIDENRQKYILSSDPIRAFVELAIDTNDKNHLTLVTDVYDAYVRFCSDKKLGIETRQTLTRRLGLQGLVKKQDTNKKGNQPWYWIGVKLKDYAATEDGQEALDFGG